MAVCTITGIVQDSEENLIEGAKVRWTHDGYMHGNVWVVGQSIEVLTNASGVWTVDIKETETVDKCPYTVEIEQDIVYTWTDIQVPNIGAANFGDIAPEPVANLESDPTDATGPIRKDFGFTTAEDFLRTVTFTDSGGTPIDISSLSAAEMEFSCEESFKTIRNTLTLGSGVTMPGGGTDGQLRWELDDTDTDGLKAGLWYRLTLTGYPNAGPKTVLYGHAYLIS